MRYLKQLTLHGYKTFASRTEFIFDAGVTAIVGPNGSGKSNVADALRWVLGEQSFSALRGKRTEDMIFSGSEQRPRMGMAQVTLILDNSSNWLPVDFAEIEISRRAYRSGENEYYLNGNRVRLRDISELLGSSGLSERTYSVIGQGLVDQALSQRPEERRKLFEEAAGITVHQSKREQASQRLAETATNLTRARDIISELTPRLRYLKGQARRAQEYQQLRADLELHLKTWYGYRWRQALLALADARNRATDAGTAAEESVAELTALLDRVAARREERNQLRDQLSEWHRASSTLHRQAETVQRELAVRAEQVRLWREQTDDLGRELTYLAAALDDGGQRLATAKAELAEAQAEHAARAKQVQDAERDLQGRERERAAQARVLAQAQDLALTLRTQLAERRSQLGQIAGRRSELAGSDAEQVTSGKAAEAELAEHQKQVAALTAKSDELAAAYAAVERDRTAQAAALAGSQEAERKAQEQLSAAQRAVARLQDQQDMLERLRDEGAGLSGGARAVIAAARASSALDEKRPSTPGAGSRRPSAQDAFRPGANQLSGILGTLGELINVPAQYERALEAALGGRAQDIVVRGWQDAEAGVDFLKRNQAGRATFLPLDSLRPGRPADAPKAPGVIGLATDLVTFDAQVRPAVELALNYTLVVQDLATARRLLGRGGGPTLVTLDGEIVRPSGAVTGGADNRQRDGGLLARSRQLRELPEQIAQAAAVVEAREREVRELRQAQASARTALDGLRARRDELSQGQARLNNEIGKAQLGAQRAQQTVAWHAERRKALEREAADLDRREGELQKSIANLEAQAAQRDTAVEEARRKLSELSAEDAVAEVARIKAEAAVSAGALRGLEGRIRELANGQSAREQELQSKRARHEHLTKQQAESQHVIEAQSKEAARLTSEITALAAKIEPAEARLAELERDARQAEQQERSLRDQQRLAQARQNQADLAAQRAQDELTHLRGEIEKDLGLVELTQFAEDAGDSQAVLSEELLDTQPPLPLNGMVTRLPVVVELPEGLDADVRHLRAQIARLGPVNLDALVEYQEVETRYNFLQTQSADLDQAVATLQEVIAELDRVMEREFVATFKAVAAKFKDEFVNLFGGGSAKLVMTDPDSPTSTGIEIMARPPGKREQGLALLSGGERALTAAALIFSILKTRPTPFCVLDEVDAALDEANVGRFRDAIKTLGQETQFILVTHNRGTIEAADTIYGVSMGPDHTSTTLSLKLDGKDLVTANAVEA